jgi:CDK-activating kinase assembly factor MAT1
VDVAETEAKIQAYEKENKDIISVNATRYENEKRAMKFQDRIDKEEREQRHQEYVEQLEEERRAKQMEKADIITELATTNKSAQAVIQTRQATALKRSSALRQQQGTSDNNSSSRMTMPSYITTAMDMDTDMRESEARNFDPLDLQYEYTTGYTVRENYNDP